MRKLLMAAAALVAMGAGPAHAACSTKDLAGEWALDVSFSCVTLTCSAICSGKFNKSGVLKTKACVAARGDLAPSVELRLRVDKACRISGSANYWQGDGGLPRSQVIKGFLGAGADQIMAYTYWIGPNGPFDIRGSLDGMRVAP